MAFASSNSGWCTRGPLGQIIRKKNKWEMAITVVTSLGQGVGVTWWEISREELKYRT